MNYDLPTSVDIDGCEYAIRSDFRPILDIILAMNDPDLTDREKMAVTLINFYENPKELTNPDEAIKKAMWFINGGKNNDSRGAKPTKVFDWEQDWDYIVAAINTVIGKDIRSIKLHWWTFLSAFMEIGEGTFSTIIGIRRKKAKGQKLEKYEREFYRENASIIDFKNKCRWTKEERELLGIPDDE